MLAMETLAKKVHEDRPQTKYAKNPPNGEDVKWLLHVSFKLGTRPSSHYVIIMCAKHIRLHVQFVRIGHIAVLDIEIP